MGGTSRECAALSQLPAFGPSQCSGTCVGCRAKCHVDVIAAIAGGLSVNRKPRSEPGSGLPVTRSFGIPLAFDRENLSAHFCSGRCWARSDNNRVYIRTQRRRMGTLQSRHESTLDGWPPGLQKLRGRLRRIRSELRWNPSKLAGRGEAVVSNTPGYS